MGKGKTARDNREETLHLNSFHIQIEYNTPPYLLNNNNALFGGVYDEN